MRTSRLVIVGGSCLLLATTLSPTIGHAAGHSRQASAQVRHRQYLLTVPGGTKGDRFGTSVAVGKNLIAVGAPYRTVNGHKNQGAVYVFQKPASGWGHATVSTVLTVAGNHANQYFGSTVAIAGNTVAVGTPLVTFGTNIDQGAVYLFTRPAGGWAGLHHPTGQLYPTDRTSNDFFGAALAASGNTFVVGAPGHVVGQHSRQGAAYVFVRPGSGWQSHNLQAAELVAADGTAGNQLGYSVAISGRTVAAGAPFVGLGQHPSAGAAYVFTEPSAGWQPITTDRARFTVRHPASKDYFGYAVAVSGGSVVAGAPYRQVGTNKLQGAAYVYDRGANGWVSSTQNATLTIKPGVARAYFANGLAFAGSRIIGAGFGLASIFTRPALGWEGTRHQQVQLAGETSGDPIGKAVAIFGSTIVAGAPTQTVGHDPYQGAAYVFIR